MKNKQYNKYQNWQNIGKETAKSGKIISGKSVEKAAKQSVGKNGKCVEKNGENIVKEIGKKIGEKISK